jgi:hypothetical protein
LRLDAGSTAAIKSPITSNEPLKRFINSLADFAMFAVLQEKSLTIHLTIEQ